MNSYQTEVTVENTVVDSSIQTDSVLVEAKYSALIPGPATYCSMVGHVKDVGASVEWLEEGDKVVALAAPRPVITLKADDCLKLNDNEIVTETTAYWALVLALAPVINLSQLEIGERVLIVSNDLTGQVLADLAWMTGARSCVIYDSSNTNSGDSIARSESETGPKRIDDLSAEDANSQAQPVDLLIYASDDLTQLEASLSWVRDTGRVLVVDQNHGSRFDFDLYPDLHKRSIKLVGWTLPNSLRDLQKESNETFPDPNQVMGYVRHQVQAERFHFSTWPIDRLKTPDADELSHLLTEGKQSGLLIEW